MELLHALEKNEAVMKVVAIFYIIYDVQGRPI